MIFKNNLIKIIIINIYIIEIFKTSKNIEFITFEVLKLE